MFVLHLLTIFGSFGYLQTAPNIIRNISDCSITENGILQYRGKHSVSRFGHECLPWNQFEEIFHDVLNQTNFLDMISIVGAENFCRNPTMNITGPWCFVHNGDTISMEGCDVCQSLTQRPIFNEEEGEEEQVDENDHPNDLRQTWRGYGVYLREKFLDIIRRIKDKMVRFTSKFI